MTTNLLKTTLLLIFLIVNFFSFSQEDEKIVIVIIDGARYTETLGDPTPTSTPQMHDKGE